MIKRSRLLGMAMLAGALLTSAVHGSEGAGAAVFSAREGGGVAVERQCRTLDSKKELLSVLRALPLEALGVTAPPETALVYDAGLLFDPAGGDLSIRVCAGSFAVEDRARSEQLSRMRTALSYPDLADPWIHRLEAGERTPAGAGMSIEEAALKAKTMADMLGLVLEQEPADCLFCSPESDVPFYCFRYAPLLDGLPLYAGQFPVNGFVGNGSAVPLPFTVALTGDRLLYLEAPLIEAFAAKGTPSPLVTAEQATVRMRDALAKRYPDSAEMEIQSFCLCQFGFTEKGNSAYGYQVLPTWVFTVLKTDEGEGRYPDTEYLDAITGERRLWADTAAQPYALRRP